MRVKTLQIVWHNQEPVFSVDFNRDGLLASAGGDKEIKLWKMDRDRYTKDPIIEHLGTIRDPSLTTVNCVRWSPTGKVLASGGDCGKVFLWHEPDNAPEPKAAFGDDPGDKPTKWRIKHNYKAHTDDVQDISWAPDGTAFATASIDNNCVVWDAASKNPIIRFADHKHYVQGIAWDPSGPYIASLSADRSCRVYGPKPPAAGKKAGRAPSNAGTCAAAAKDMFCQHVLTKRTYSAAGEENVPMEAATAKERHFMFHDDTLPTFFRRLCWSPDGAMLVVPGASYRGDGAAEAIHASYVFAHGGWNAPAMVLPAVHKPSVVVRFCPRVFRRRTPTHELQGVPGAIATPYRMIFAVGTLDSIILYDTELAAPFALLGGLHFAAITDLTWSTDGQFLVASSRDGYCSVVAFDSGELGDVVPNAEVEATVAARMVAAQKSLRPLEAQQPRGGGTPGGHVPRAPEAATPVAAPVIVEAPVAEVAAPVAEVAAPVAGAAPAAAPPGLADAATKRRIVPTAVQAVVPVRELAPPSDGAAKRRIVPQKM